MRRSLQTTDVLDAIEGYLEELRTEAQARPHDQRLQNKMLAVTNVRSRIKLLARGSIRVIQGGRNTKENTT